MSLCWVCLGPQKLKQCPDWSVALFLLFHNLTSKWSEQNVEENECRRAHDMAVEKYNEVFNKDVNPDEVSCQYPV